jgi:hypothetical protein
METIEDIDQTLTPIFNRLLALADDLAFTYVGELSDTPLIAQQAYPGIYRIDIATASAHTNFDSWITQFRADWDLEEYKALFTCTTKDKRIRRHGILNQWIPLYLGKSKNVARRVKEHLTLPLKARTFALKIHARPKMAERKFRLHTLPMNITHYDLIAPVLEKALRDRFNPIVGKQ